MQNTQFNETEQALLSAALEEFSRHGKQGARMQDIADRAGLNKALLHYYFRSKERLYEEVFTFVFQHYFKQIAASIENEGDFVSNLRTFIHRYIELLNANPALPMFLMREIAEGAPVFSRRIAEMAGNSPFAFPMMFLRFFERGRNEGAIIPADPLQSMISIMGACIYFFVGFPVFSAMMPELQARKEQLIEERKDHIFDLVYYGLKPRTE